MSVILEESEALQVALYKLNYYHYYYYHYYYCYYYYI